VLPDRELSYHGSTILCFKHVNDDLGVFQHVLSRFPISVFQHVLRRLLLLTEALSPEDLTIQGAF
jgi:hypothetical protein